MDDLSIHVLHLAFLGDQCIMITKAAMDDRKRISVRTGLDSSPSRSTRDGIVFVGIDAVGWLAGWRGSE